MLRSPVYFYEVVGDCFLLKVTILNDLFLSFDAFPDLGDHRIAGPNHEDFVCNLVELLHVPFSHKVRE